MADGAQSRAERAGDANAFPISADADRLLRALSADLGVETSALIKVALQALFERFEGDEAGVTRALHEFIEG